ncbi:MAG: sulfurtransferase-like selenium metabolism protein YedF [Acidobacteriota bacterium]
MSVLYITSDRIGDGDEPLGRLLLRNFLGKLAESGEKVERILLLNRGIFLALEGAETLETLREMEAKGAVVTACLTCLDHYGAEDRLRVGVPGTMGEAVEALRTADRVLRP